MHHGRLWHYAATVRGTNPSSLVKLEAGLTTLIEERLDEGDEGDEGDVTGSLPRFIICVQLAAEVGCHSKTPIDHR